MAPHEALTRFSNLKRRGHKKFIQRPRIEPPILQGYRIDGDLSSSLMLSALAFVSRIVRRRAGEVARLSASLHRPPSAGCDQDCGSAVKLWFGSVTYRTAQPRWPDSPENERRPRSSAKSAGSNRAVQRSTTTSPLSRVLRSRPGAHLCAPAGSIDISLTSWRPRPLAVLKLIRPGGGPWSAAHSSRRLSSTKGHVLVRLQVAWDGEYDNA